MPNLGNFRLILTIMIWIFGLRTECLKAWRKKTYCKLFSHKIPVNDLTPTWAQPQKRVVLFSWIILIIVQRNMSWETSYHMAQLATNLLWWVTSQSRTSYTQGVLSTNARIKSLTLSLGLQTGMYSRMVGMSPLPKKSVSAGMLGIIPITVYRSCSRTCYGFNDG